MRSYNSSGKLQYLISDLDYSLLIDSSNLLFIGQTSSRAAETRLGIIVRRAVSCHEETASARASDPSMFDWRSAIPPRAASCINSMPRCVTELWISSAGRDALRVRFKSARCDAVTLYNGRDRKNFLLMILVV